MKSARLDFALDAAFQAFTAELVALPGTPPGDSEIEDLYSELFGDDDFYAEVRDFIENWIDESSKGPFQTAMRTEWEVLVANDMEPQSKHQELLVALFDTRADRWEALAQQKGFKAPEELRLYRGVRGETIVKALIEQWKTGKTYVEVAAHSLSSWSLDKDSALRFASDPASSLLYEAEVPIDQTLLDMWVDDAGFLRDYPGEREVIMAAPGEPVTTRKEWVTVVYKGRTYQFSDRDALFAEWDRDHS